MIAVIDYSAGNLQSVKNALNFINCEHIITSDPETITSADSVILPGVGAFGDAMAALNGTPGLAGSVRRAALSGKPFLGICLGLQLLFSSSEESPGVPGLCVFPGEIKKIPAGEGLKVPHIGWNSLYINRTSALLQGLGESPHFYFVHSYYLDTNHSDIIVAESSYGVPMGTLLQKGNIMAAQFHPEKSGKVGLRMLRNFIKIVEGK